MEIEKNSTCPFHVCKLGTQIYDVVNSKGLINYLKEPLEIDEEFVASTNIGRGPPRKDFNLLATVPNQIVTGIIYKMNAV